MSRTYTFTRETQTRLSATEAWAHATRPAGVNAEFRPLMRMTFPAELEHIAEGWHPGRTLFRSWILLFGFVPIEYDDLALVEVEENARFLERSEMGLVRMWEHERTFLEGVEDANGVRIRDRVRFVPRFAWLGPLQQRIFGLVFRYRHARLERLYGVGRR